MAAKAGIAAVKIVFIRRNNSSFLPNAAQAGGEFPENLPRD
jgi:hypothetical protein